jgi:2-oxoglutarate dehydrogenase E1 component
LHHAANFFHALRRQFAWEFRKPMIVFTPKSLLRHPHCVSKLDDLANGSFQELIDDDAVLAKVCDRDLHSRQGPLRPAEHREKNGIMDTALVRIEQLHPLADRSDEGGAQEVRQGRESHLGARRAEEHGRMATYVDEFRRGQARVHQSPGERSTRHGKQQA